MNKKQHNAYEKGRNRVRQAEALIDHAILNRDFSVGEIFEALMNADKNSGENMPYYLQEWAEDNILSGKTLVTTHNIKQEAALAEFLQTLHNIY